MTVSHLPREMDLQMRSAADQRSCLYIKHLRSVNFIPPEGQESDAGRISPTKCSHVFPVKKFHIATATLPLLKISTRPWYQCCKSKSTQGRKVAQEGFHLQNAHMSFRLKSFTLPLQHYPCWKSARVLDINAASQKVRTGRTKVMLLELVIHLWYENPFPLESCIFSFQHAVGQRPPKGLKYYKFKRGW